MRDPETRRRLVAEAQTPDPAMLQFLDPAKAFPLGDPPNYEPDPSTSIAARAAAEGRDVYDLYYDLLMEDDGHALVMRPLLNYTDCNLDAVREMLLHPTSASVSATAARTAARRATRRTPDVHAHALGPRPRPRPAPARVGRAQDDVGDRVALRPRRPRRACARACGRRQRHRLRPAAAPRRPHMVHDLPGGARRFVQEADGYVATVVAGQVTLIEGQDTGARPGALVRGQRPA